MPVSLRTAAREMVAVAMIEARRENAIIGIAQVQVGHELGYTCIGETPTGKCHAPMRACALESVKVRAYFRALRTHDEGCDVGTRSAGTVPGVPGEEQPITPAGGLELILTLHPAEPPPPRAGTAPRSAADATMQVRHQTPHGDPAPRPTPASPEAFLRALVTGSISPSSLMPTSTASKDLAPVSEVLVHANSLQEITRGHRWFWGTLSGGRKRDRYDARSGWSIQSPLPRLVLSVTDNVAAHLEPSSPLRNPATASAHFLIYAGQDEASAVWSGAPAMVVSSSSDVLAVLAFEESASVH